ncbi:MAG: hypothetical protein HY403_03590 [Elusimicrobia bacterium]|nr:hypothetical protein [Elusimicrobiota bacterium]
MKIARKTLPFLAGAALALWAAAAGAQTTLDAVRFRYMGPILDASLPEWKKARPVTVQMLPQMVATPRQSSPAVKELKVRAAHNGHWIGILIEWSDATRDDRIVLDRFGDMVAVEFPIGGIKDATPNPMMGNPGGRVNILQWRAAFQRDIDAGEPQLKDLYPNASVDLYPDQVLRATDARPYTGALGMDNPVSRAKASPVLDQMAEGFGTMTVKPEQHADGKGVWANGKWRVVITAPMAAQDPGSPHFMAGDRTLAAFAVWDGASREVGSRKAWSSWVPLRLAR